MLTRPPYAPLGADTLPDRLWHRPELTRLLGPPAQWRVREVGDGNLNLVFIVEGRDGSLVVKQALPYARVVGESWPMSLDRAFFEYEASLRLGARDPGRMPTLHLFDREQALQVMEHLTPHIILRKGLIAGTRYPALGEHLGHFLARTLFRGSDWAMETAHRKADLALFAGNVELCGITEDLFFTDPFFDCPRNRHNPALDAEVATVRADRALKLAALRLKARFCTGAETLLHGDFHTGSVMVSAQDSRVIDAEFATYGPMGFDIGSLLANLWMAAFSQEGLRPGDADARAYRRWIRDLAAQIWRVFTDEFARLWRTERAGILGGHDLFEAQSDREGAEQALAARLAAIWHDTLGFAGLEMYRRVLGLAHIAEFEAIGDEAARGACERRALRLGRALAVTPERFADVAAVNALAVELDGGER
ncbi:S-methyl-5-thioribose kinase [Ancylobacter sp. MQZ15Z-1]|uniref:S-methyl-5-thioribose kinase n=1 Tax=Ancylobacter mangrovi TaxID=2972472 RepID=A0A9X2PEJ2_9HYPH|nr:S-methyl-5-thioribose kinase [Ancylobacter mangrovi]MCS0496450.1 S-methyl-5-thioribose kinase [Ancylobacter mangrovi]